MGTHFRQDAGPPIWGIAPATNPSGSYVLFETNRGMTTGDFNGQTWVKNMKTGDERFAFSGAKGQILGWVDDRTVILLLEAE